MKFVYSSRMVLAVNVFLITVGFNAEKASAIELVNDSALMATLKKNRVLSEKDVVALSNEYPTLEIRGSLQFQYINSADPVTNKVNEMDLRRLNLSVFSQVSDKVSLLIEPEYGKGMPSIRDAYFAYKLPGVGVIAGNHRVPFSAEGLQNDINLRFVERTLTSQISPDRLVGVSVLKKMSNDKIIAQAGLWNSKLNSKAESGLINNILADNQIFSSKSGEPGNNINIVAFRIGSSTKERSDFYSRGNGFNEGENFSNEASADWGISYYNSASATTNNPTPGVTGLNGANAYEADISFGYKRFAGEVEYAKRNLEWWQYNPLTVNPPVNSVQTSYSAQASVLVRADLSLALRFETFVYDGKDKVLKGAFGQDQDNWITVGLNYYSKEQNTKIQLNYISKDEVMPVGLAPRKNNTTLIQGTAYF